MPPGHDDPPAPPGDGSKRVPREVVLAFLSRKDTLAWVNAHVASKVKPRDVEQVAQDALEEATRAAGSVEHEAALSSWLRTITDRAVADHLEKLRRRKKHEGPMPAAPERLDEAGEPVDPDSFAEDLNAPDIDPSTDPTREDMVVRGRLMSRFLRSAVKGRPRDEETLAWMIAWSEGDKTYEQIANENGISYGALRKRTHDFRERYLPEWEKQEMRLWLLVFLGFVAIVAAIALYLWMHPRPKREESIANPPPVPSASASAAPTVVRPAIPDPAGEPDGGPDKPPVR